MIVLGTVCVYVLKKSTKNLKATNNNEITTAKSPPNTIWQMSALFDFWQSMLLCTQVKAKTQCVYKLNNMTNCRYNLEIMLLSLRSLSLSICGYLVILCRKRCIIIRRIVIMIVEQKLHRWIEMIRKLIWIEHLTIRIKLVILLNFGKFNQRKANNQQNIKNPLMW